MEKSKFLVSLICFISATLCGSAKAENEPVDLNPLKQEISQLKSAQQSLKEDIVVLTRKLSKSESKITTLEEKNRSFIEIIDSLQNEYNKLCDNQKSDKTELSSSINQTIEKVQATEEILSSRTIWGICGIIALVVALVVTVWSFLKKFRMGFSSIDGVRKAQESLEKAQESIRKAQEKMQEESIQLDNKLIEMLSKQPLSTPVVTPSGDVDHSLTLKVADEIVKIEMNLSHMDESIRGYRQLSRGVQRIKDNFKANDYEIVDMLGKPYQDGTKAAVTFVTDENLEPGQQIITRIIKPQVNYKQVMIQAAQIEVSQAE